MFNAIKIQSKVNQMKYTKIDVFFKLNPWMTYDILLAFNKSLDLNILKAM